MTSQIFLCFLAGAAVATAQDAEMPREVFRVSVDVVQVDAFVGKSGRPVLGLGPEDFEVYDDGVLQEVAAVEMNTEPVSVVMVFDSSSSVEGEKLRYLKDAADSLLDELGEDDEAALLTFSSSLDSTGEFSNDPRTVRRALEAVHGFGVTSLYDALYAGLQMTEGRKQPVLVVFTDGADNFSWLTEEEVYAVVRESSAVVDVVATALGLDRNETREALWASQKMREFLGDVTGTSGGQFRSAASLGALKGIFREIASEMENRYTITYFPRGVSRENWHELDVRVEGKDVFARRGYFAGPAPDSAN